MKKLRIQIKNYGYKMVSFRRLKFNQKKLNEIIYVIRDLFDDDFNLNISWSVFSTLIIIDKYMKPKFVSHTFQIRNQVQKEFRYIRMIQIGPTLNGYNHLLFSDFEIFEKLL